eukprot:jgi/Galph1/1761/GphlegSOOS_G455.1
MKIAFLVSCSGHGEVPNSSLNHDSIGSFTCQAFRLPVKGRFYENPNKRSNYYCTVDNENASSKSSTGQEQQNEKNLYRPLSYPVNTEAYLSSEPIREALWKYTFERSQREEEADKALEELGKEVKELRKEIESLLDREGVDPQQAFKEADEVLTPYEQVLDDPVAAAIKRGCPPDDIDTGDYPYIDVPDIPENLELENLGWVGMKQMGANPLPEMIDDMWRRRHGVARKNKVVSSPDSALKELENDEDEWDQDAEGSSIYNEQNVESKIYVKEGLGWRIGYEPFCKDDQCATVGSKDYLITMNKEEFFHFRRLLMSLDHKVVDMLYHSADSSSDGYVDNEATQHFFVNPHEEEVPNGAIDSELGRIILDLESDVVRVQALGSLSWFSLRVFLKRKRPVECSWDPEATKGLLQAIHEVDSVAGLL